MQVKRCLKILGGGGGVGIVKNGCGRAGEETLKLTGSEKLKAEQKFFGWAWSAVSVASLAMGL